MLYLCTANEKQISCKLTENTQAKIAQLVERNLAKVEVAGSNPVFRSFFYVYIPKARMVESVDTLDLKSSGQQCLCGFKSRSEYEQTIITF